MTTIHTTIDLVRALREQPEFMEAVRALVLTDELLNLPGRTDRLEEALQRLTERVSNLTEAVQRLTEQMEGLTTAVEGMKTETAGMRTSIGALNGHYLEQRVIDNILNVIKDDLDLTRGRVLRRSSGDMDPQLRAAIEEAEERSLISDDEVDNLLVADVIIRARRRADRRYVYGVIEISRTIHDRDIDRARNRADTLATVTGEEVIAVVTGAIITPRSKSWPNAGTSRQSYPPCLPKSHRSTMRWGGFHTRPTSSTVHQTRHHLRRRRSRSLRQLRVVQRNDGMLNYRQPVIRVAAHPRHGVCLADERARRQHR